MTVQEAIELHLKPLKERAFAHTTETALNMAIESMEKQIPKKPKKMGKDAINDLDVWVECSCGAMKKVDAEKHKQMYCWKCGQLLSWEEGGTSD